MAGGGPSCTPNRLGALPFKGYHRGDKGSSLSELPGDELVPGKSKAPPAAGSCLFIEKLPRGLQKGSRLQERPSWSFSSSPESQCPSPARQGLSDKWHTPLPSSLPISPLLPLPLCSPSPLLPPPSSFPSSFCLFSPFFLCPLFSLPPLPSPPPGREALLRVGPHTMPLLGGGKAGAFKEYWCQADTEPFVGPGRSDTPGGLEITGPTLVRPPPALK